MTLRLTEDVLAVELGPATVDKGRRMRAGGHVRGIDVSADGASISGSVASSRGEGPRRQSYSQTISLAPAGGRIRIKGYCTCPVGINCKHVAAALLEQAARTGGAPATEILNEPPVAAETLAGLSWHAPGAAGAKGHAPPAAQSQPRSALSRPVSDWIDRLMSAAAPPASAERTSHPSQKNLFYVLDHADALPGMSPVRARIRPVTARQRKDGSLAGEKRYDPENVMRPREQRAGFLTEADLAILRDLAWVKRTAQAANSIDVVLGADAASRRILEALLATSRLRHGALNGPVLRAGQEVRGEPRWIKGERGGQRLVFAPFSQERAEPGPSNGAEPDHAQVRFDVVLPLQPPHYVDLATGRIGAILTGLPPGLAIEVARAPAVAPAEAAHVKEVIRQRLTPTPARSSAEARERPPGAGSAAPSLLPLPEAADDVEMRFVTPKPRLELMMTEARLKPGYVYHASDQRHRGAFPLPIARLSFDYAAEIVPIHSTIETLDRVEAGRLIVTPRDHKAEVQAAERLSKLGLKALNALPFNVSAAHARDFFIAPPGNAGFYDLIASYDDPSRFIAFSAEGLPLLVREGWRIAFSDDYPFQIIEGAPEWWAGIGEGSGIDWFSFELGIAFEGHRINLVPQLANILAQLPAELIALAGQDGAEEAFAKICKRLRLYHTLPDRRLLPLPGERLAPILHALLQLIGPRDDSLIDGKVRLHRAEAAALAGFAAGAGRDVTWAANAERLIELGQDLRRGRGIKAVKPPKSFKASLRPYQADGLAWLEFLRGAGLGGVLADDMGLGKTVQALAFLAREKAEGRLDKPALIVSPTSVLPNWQAEAGRFAPQLRVLALRGLDRRELFGEIAKHDLVLTTYPLLARDHEVLLAGEFHAAILDEAQAIKNPKATISRLVRRIDARHRLALTGTPLENNLGEVWSLFDFLSPGLLGDETTFRRTFRTPIEKHGDQAAQAFLSRRLKPFMLRRTKGEVAKELPPKTEIVERVRLEGGQRDLYETVRALMHAKVRDEIAKKGLAKSLIIFLDALLKLRQTCCDPRLLKMPQAKKVKGSAKLERLMEMLPELAAEGRRILLFSQFTSMLELIEPELTHRGIAFVKLTGDTTDRAAPVERFQSGETPVFLLSLKAGGTGLNLTAADTVIHYDPWWNPAVENQATDRAYRIGQDKPVFVYKLIVEEGIEEAIELLKARKAALAEALFAGSAKSPLDLSEADISALFAPLGNKPMRRAA